MGKIFIIDSMGVLADLKSEVLERHFEYSELLFRYTDNTEILTIISPAKINCEKIYGETLIHLRLKGKKRISYRFVRNCLFILKSQDSNNFILIASDPWESFLTCLLIKIFTNKRIQIQVQLHADIGDPKWRKFSYMFHFRSLFARFTIPKGDSLRVVSDYQLENLIQQGFHIPLDHFVSPVMLNIVPNFRPQSIDRHQQTYLFGFVGRLESDRGIQQFVSVIKLAASKNRDFKVAVIGKGPMASKLLDKLYEFLPKNAVMITYAGTRDEMSRLWKEISILVSTAPAESYGRSLREAIIHGTRVLSNPTSGAKELSQHTKGIDFIDSGCDEATLNNIDRLRVLTIPLEEQMKILSQNANASEILVKSWIRMMEKFKQ